MSEENIELLSVENFDNFCFNDILYEKKEVVDFDAMDLLNNDYSVRYFCPYCKEISIFKLSEDILKSPNMDNFRNARALIARIKYFTKIMETIIFNCSLKPEHKIYFNFLVYDYNEKLYIAKIGQYPKTIDLKFPDKNKYDKHLGKFAIEYKTALQVISNGIGIGSFVYLRRVFEFLIEETHKELKAKEKHWNEQEYNEAIHLEDKIKICEMFVKIFPDELAQHKMKIYGILSKGIHELDEAECNKHFNLLKYLIERILDHNLEAEKEKLKLQEAIKKISSI